MEKIILTRKQAVALEKALENNFTKEIVLKTHVSANLNGNGKWKGDNYQYLNELSVEEMAIALYVGYEVEETKEEKLSIHFNEIADKISNNNDEDNFNYGYCLGIEKALDMLEITIEGIND